jgi:hypothetical protein
MATSFEKDPVQLLGRDLKSPEVSTWLRSVDPKTKVVVLDRKPRWVSKVAGLEIQCPFDSSLVTTVSFYAEGVDDFRKYKGPLPHKVTFDMKRPQVLAAVGAKPDFSSDEHNAWDFEDYRFIVMYEGNDIQSVAVTGDF